MFSPTVNAGMRRRLIRRFSEGDESEWGQAERVNKNETLVIDYLVLNAVLQGVHRSCLSAN